VLKEAETEEAGGRDSCAGSNSAAGAVVALVRTRLRECRRALSKHERGSSVRARDEQLSTGAVVAGRIVHGVARAVVRCRQPRHLCSCSQEEGEWGEEFCPLLVGRQRIVLVGAALFPSLRAAPVMIVATTK